MSNNQKKNLSPPVQQEYQKFQKQREVKRPIFTNCIKAFLIGGIDLFDRTSDPNLFHI